MKITIIGFLICFIALNSIECRPATKKCIMSIRWHGIKCLDVIDKKLQGKNKIDSKLSDSR